MPCKKCGADWENDVSQSALESLIKRKKQEQFAALGKKQRNAEAAHQEYVVRVYPKAGRDRVLAILNVLAVMLFVAFLSDIFPELLEPRSGLLEGIAATILFFTAFAVLCVPAGVVTWRLNKINDEFRKKYPEYYRILGINRR